MAAASSATGIYRRGDPGSWGASTRYVQFSSGSGVFYDRITGNVVNEVPSGSGSFTAARNQASARATYDAEISGITSAGPVGTPPPATPAAAAAALLGPAGIPPREPINSIPIPKPSAGAAAGAALRYPSSRSMTPDTDYVVFEFFEYEPPFGRGRSGDGTPVADPTLTASAGYKLYQGNRGKKTFDPIVLYMPEDIQSQFSGRWSGAQFGTAFAGLARVMGTDIDGNAITAGIDSAKGMLKTQAFQTAVDAINKGLNSSVTLNQLMGGVSGTVVNPNVEMMYEAPDLRNFSLTFKMTPHDGNEAKVIRKICQRFKKAMLPSFGGQALFGTVVAPNLITIPNLCQVTFMKGDAVHPSLPQYKQCAISNVDINYTPDGSYATFGDADGTPVSTSITVAFKETKIIFADEINESGASY